MKTVVVILAVLTAALGWAAFQRGGAITASTQAFQSVSNELAETRTKLALEQSNAAVAQSNLQASVSGVVDQLLAVSNRLTQTSLLLSKAEHETSATRIELQTKVALEVTEAHRDELQRRLEVIPALERERAALNERLTAAHSERDKLIEALGLERVLKAQLEQKLDDPSFLRPQLSKAEDAVAVRQQVARSRPIPPSDRRALLKWQPDGTVRAQVPASDEKP